MEHGHPAAPPHSPVLDHHPPHEPTAVVGDEEQHHEKKSIMTRIHNKVNKMKHNYKNRHAHDQVSDVPVEEESEEFDGSHEDMDVDSKDSSNLSVYESLSSSREFDSEHGLVTPGTIKPHVFGGRDEPPVTLKTDKPHIHSGRDEPPVMLKLETCPKPSNESSVPPEVLSSLQAMSISKQRRDQPPSKTQPGPEDETLTNHMSSDMEKKPSYTENPRTTAAADKEAAASTEYSAGTVSGLTATPPPSYSEKFSSTAFAAKDAAVSAASMMYAKVAGKEGGTHSGETRSVVVAPVSNVSGTEEGAGEKKESYTDRAFEAKDAAVMAASTMYGMMVGAGAAMMGNVVEPEQDKGVSVREFSAEEDEVVMKGRIELPEVKSREVVSDAPAEVLTDAPPAVDEKSGGYTGQGMVQMITGAVTSFVSGGGGVADAQAASSGGGRGGVADAPSGGAGKERDSEVLGE